MRILITSVSVIAVLAGGALIAPSFVDWNKYKEEARTQVKTIAGYDLDLRGDLKLQILPFPALKAEDASLSAPGQTAADTLLTLKRVDVQVALFPLLSGNIEISSVNLVDPVIIVGVQQDGRQSWMTPELDAMMNKDKPKQEGKKPISVQNVKIKNGTFQYFNKQTNSTTQITNVNVDMDAKTLQGPFDVDGSIKFGEQDIKFNAKAGEIAADTKSLPLKAKISAAGADVDYSGVVTLGEAPGAQGEIMLNVASLADVVKPKDGQPPALSGPLKISGMLTATKEKADIKNAQFELGKNKLAGNIAVNMNPMDVQAAFKGQDVLNLDDLLPKKAKAKGEGFKHPGEMLPEKLDIALPFTFKATMDLPGVIYGGQTYKNVSAGASNNGQSLIVAGSAGSIPGQGSAEFRAETPLSTPSFNVSLKGQTQDVNKTVSAFTGAPVAALKAVKTAQIDMKATLTRAKLTLNESTLMLDDSRMVIGGALTNTKTARQLLTVDLSADTLDLDKYSTAPAAQTQEKKDPAAALKTLALPMDVNFDVGVQTLKMQGKTIKGLRAQGALTQNAISLTNLSVQDYAGAAATAKGGISNLQALSGINMDVAVKAADLRATMAALGKDSKGIPESVKSLEVKAHATGSADALAVNADIGAFGGTFTTKGNVATPLTAPGISALAVQIKHPNTANFLKAVAPGMPDYVSLAKPMNVSFDVAQSDKTYAIKNLKGDLAGSTLDGNLSIGTGGAKPSVTGTLRFGKLALQTAKGQQMKAGANSNAPATPSGAGGKWSTQTMNNDWMNAADMNLDIAATALTYQTWDLANPTLKFKLGGGTLNIDQLSAGLYSGTVSMNGTVSALQGGGLSVKAAPRMQGIQLEPLVSSLVGTRLLKGRGEVNLNADISGSGKSQAALISALQGSGTTTGKSIVLEGFDLAKFAEAMSEDSKPGDTLTGLFKTSISGGSTSFDTMDGAFTINQGVINISKLDLEGPEASLVTKGTVSLPAWHIKTAHTITAKKNTEVPPFTVNIDGPLDKPAQTMAGGAINDYLQRKLERKIGKELEGKFGDKINEKLGGNLGGALGGMLGIPQKQQAPAVTTTPTPAPAETPAPEAAPVQPEPAPAPAEEAPPPATQQQAPTPEEAIGNMLKGLMEQ